MSKKRLGQDPAFPLSKQIRPELFEFNEGMSKRLWIATHIVAADIVAKNNVIYTNEGTEDFVEYAYSVADELLKQEKEYYE